VVYVLCLPERGASQVEKSPRLNWATQCLTVAYDGACSPTVSIRIAWISFGAFPCRGRGREGERERRQFTFRNFETALVSFSRIGMSKERGYSEPWEWIHYVASKRREQITQRRGVTSRITETTWRKPYLKTLRHQWPLLQFWLSSPGCVYISWLRKYLLRQVPSKAHTKVSLLDPSSIAPFYVFIFLEGVGTRNS
jgi:hypothetical protein